MNYIKLLFAVCLTMITATYSNAQMKKKIYYLVDTVNVPPLNRIVEITGRGEVMYVFHCKCLPEKQNIIFAHLESQNAKPTVNRPNLPYTSWKELLGLVDNNLVKFGDMYDMYITEKLPNGKYMTNKVFYVVKRIVN